ncbi:MAG TPA: outer membrane beta-barrel protein, partial [Chryseosolibacter sp.]|nr:outer membrane beta-barrel protein [Chryseosolibacter sp.]
MGKFYCIVLVSVIAVSQLGWTQTLDCEQTIALATEEFNAGHFHSVPTTLSKCLTDFNRDQRQRAFLLLTQIYLLVDDPIGAQNSYLQVLTANPEFIPDEQLHAIDVVYLSKKFTATPRFSLFVNGGSNVAPARVIRDLDIPKDGEEKYTVRAGYQFGAGVEYSYDDHIRVRLELNYLHTTYKAQAIDYADDDVKTFIDGQTWMNIPFYVSYADHIGQIRPYGYVGYSISRLFGDRASVQLKKIDGEGEETTSFEAASPDFDFFDRRNKLNQSFILGGGVKYKVGLDFVYADLRYNMGLKNIVNPD